MTCLLPQHQITTHYSAGDRDIAAQILSFIFLLATALCQYVACLAAASHRAVIKFLI